MQTREEIQAKSDATQLKNLLLKKARKMTFSKRDETFLKRLTAEAKAAKARAPKQKRDLSQNALPR